jgi:sulfate adenylyltransferase subunit 1
MKHISSKSIAPTSARNGATTDLHTAKNTTVHRPLRFITCGSVDDGKSTLIGRLLFDSKALMIDQLDALGRARGAQTRAGELDLSLVTDGLEAEREQGITIDVAYRYFATPNRKFIIADAPGHEQYTRNMVTGASKSDVAVILIDVTKLDFTQTEIELLPQTKRHSAIAGLLGIDHLVVAVNKMDAIAFDEAKFERVVAAFKAIAQTLSLPPFTAIPISALKGDGVVAHTENTSWFDGLSLLATLEAIDLESRDDVLEPLSAHIAVQYVTRDVADDHLRWIMGDVADAPVAVGDAVQVFPSGASATVVALNTPRGAAEQARVGEAVAIALDRQVDVARGDWIIVSKDSAPSSQLADHGSQYATNGSQLANHGSQYANHGSQLANHGSQLANHGSQLATATLAWLDPTPLVAGRRLLARHGTRWLPVRVTHVQKRLDLNTATWVTEGSHAGELLTSANDIIEAAIEFASPLPLIGYGSSKTRGAILFVDPGTHVTSAAGLVREVL